jgi:beta-ketoacyl ACP synthase
VLIVQALRDGIVPPTLNLKNLDPEIELDVVAGGPRPANYRYAITNSFGIGGNNVAAVFGTY